MASLWGRLVGKGASGGVGRLVMNDLHLNCGGEGTTTRARQLARRAVLGRAALVGVNGGTRYRGHGPD